jgi:hypothetical protein
MAKALTLFVQSDGPCKYLSSAALTLCQMWKRTVTHYWVTKGTPFLTCLRLFNKARQVLPVTS